MPVNRFYLQALFPEFTNRPMEMTPFCSVFFIMYTDWFLCSIVKCYIQNVNETWQRYLTSDTGAQE